MGICPPHLGEENPIHFTRPVSGSEIESIRARARNSHLGAFGF